MHVTLSRRKKCSKYVNFLEALVRIKLFFFSQFPFFSMQSHSEFNFDPGCPINNEEKYNSYLLTFLILMMCSSPYREKWVLLGPQVHSPLNIYAYSILLTRNEAALHSLRHYSLLAPLSSFAGWYSRKFTRFYIKQHALSSL